MQSVLRMLRIGDVAVTVAVKSNEVGIAPGIEESGGSRRANEAVEALSVLGLRILDVTEEVCGVWVRVFFEGFENGDYVLRSAAVGIPVLALHGGTCRRGEMVVFKMELVDGVINGHTGCLGICPECPWGNT